MPYQKYYCSECGKEFHDYDECVRHENRCRMKPAPRRCFYCHGNGYVDPRKVRSLAQFVPIYDLSGKCPECGGKGWFYD